MEKVRKENTEFPPQQEEFVYETSTKPISVKWEQNVDPLLSLQLKNHSSIHFQGNIYIFGGYDGNRNHDSLYAFNLTTQKLKLVEFSGIVPKRRNGHSATLVDSKMVIIGGWLGTGPLAASDVWILDLLNLEWTNPTATGDNPGACNMHTADLYQGEIVVFRGGNGRDYLNDLHALNMRTLVWRKVFAKGKYPSERANHSSVLMGSHLYIFGGWNGYKRLNDLYMLDLKEETWITFDVKGEVPSPRAGIGFYILLFILLHIYNIYLFYFFEITYIK